MKIMNLKSAMAWIKRFIQWRSFIWALPLTIFGWILLNKLAYYYDPTSKGLDAGYIVDTVFAFIQGLGAIAFAMLGMRYIFRPFYDYYRVPTKDYNGNKYHTQMHRDFDDMFDLSKSHRWKRLFIFWLFFFSLVAVAMIGILIAR